MNVYNIAFDYVDILDNINTAVVVGIESKTEYGAVMAAIGAVAMYYNERFIKVLNSYDVVDEKEIQKLIYDYDRVELFRYEFN